MLSLENDAANTRKFKRRAFIIGALQVSVLTVLTGRLAWLQLAQGSRYKTLSDKNRINVKMIAPTRGQIVDRFGVPLAVNNQNFRVLIIPEQAENLPKVLRDLARHIDLSQEQIDKTIKLSKKQAKFVPLEIKDSLTWEEVATIEVNLPDLPGLSIDMGEVRSYPLGEATAHVVGYVGYANKAEAGDDKMLALPGFKVGRTGIEKTLDEPLRGQGGNAQVEVNVMGREVRELDRSKSFSGERVVLTLDAELQRFTQERLARERSASAIIMDAHTGAIYALASYPAFDPNMFTQGLSVEAWEELLNGPGYPLTNKAIAGQYPPASTFKMVTAMAALKAGKVNEERTIYCPGHYDYGGNRFHCWKHGGHGHVNLADALAKSCDTYFYQVATEIGIERIAEMARAFGLGQKIGLDLAEERPGLVPDKNWKMGHFGDSWKKGETVVASIGQGYLQSTPMQLGVMTARMINGGYAVKPSLVGYVGDKPYLQEKWPKMDLHQWHLTLVKRGMDKVVNHEDGTAHGSRIVESGMSMGGKTGTAQVKRINRKQRAQGITNADLPWKYRHHALFVGYAPVKNPRYVCSVVVEHGVSGSSSAAPLARDLLVETQKRDPAKTEIKLRSQEHAEAQKT